MRILVAVASKHGSTWEIARAIGDTLAVWGIRVDVAHIEDVTDLSRYDGFVLGSAVYAGHWLRPAAAFMHTHAAEFASRPVWLFSSGPLGSPLRPYESKAVDIREVTALVRVKEHRVFAGKLKTRRLGVAEKLLTGLAHAPHGDFRNWQEIRAWAAGITQQLRRQPAERGRPRAAPLGLQTHYR